MVVVDSYNNHHIAQYGRGRLLQQQLVVVDSYDNNHIAQYGRGRLL